MQRQNSILLAVGLVMCVVILSAAVAQAANNTVGGVVDSAANYVTIGVIAHITGDDNSNGSAKVWYRVQGAPTWTEGVSLYRLDTTRYVGSILWLTAATTYEVDVQLTDPDGVTSDPAPFTITTKSNTIPGQGTGTHRYVATTGNDNNPGTQSLPYRTIGKGASVANPGDVIHVMPGTYSESVAITRSGNASNYITYLAEGAGVILDSSDPAFLDATPDWTLDTGNVYYATFNGATTYVAADGVRLYPRANLTDLRNNANGVDGGFFLNTSTHRLYVSVPGSGGDPDGHTMNVATLSEAVRISSNYNVFDGFEIRYYGTDTYQTGLIIDAAIKNVIRNNTIHNCGFNIWVSGTASDDNLIANNTVYDTGITTFPWEQVKDTELEETCIFLESGWRNVIRNNVVHGSFDGISPSMWGAPNNENYNGEMDIYGNDIYNVLDDGMEIEGTDINLRVFNNTVNSCHMGISVAPVTKGPAYFVRNEIYQWANTPTQQASALKFGATSAGRVYFYHNTYATTAASQNGLEPSGDWNNVVSRNNILYASWYAIEDYYTGSRSSVDWNYDDIFTTYWVPADPRYVKWLNVKYATLAAWQAATGKELNGIAQNPLFTNLGAGDLTLQSSSPCIDHGLVLKGINDGYSGAAPDMGCYEATGAPAPPVTNFTGAPTSGYTPLAVAFTDSSTNSPTSWSWTFGDSGTATTQNPSHTYSSAGSYAVTLTATNAYGSDGETKTNYITASTPPAPPVANFTGTPTSGNAPLAVSFTDTSTNTPTSWSWTFGDSSTSTAQNPSHTYSTAGSYTVSLRATNAGGYDDEVKTNYITANAVAPVANFSGAPTSGTAPLAVSFTDSSTNTPTSWSWNFGDSTASTSQNPSHTYSSAGTYTVSLRATNAGGYDDEVKTNYITVSAGGSTPTFVAAGAVASNAAAITPALPAGIAANDILLLFLETANQAISISNQNGGTWTAVTNSPQGTGTAGGAAATRLTVFWSRYNGTQGAPTTSDSGNHQLGRIIAVRGAATSGNPWDVTAGGVESTVDTSGDIPGATTTVANTLVVAAVATALPDASGTANFSAWANANLVGLTERTDNTEIAGNGGGLALATGEKSAAGAYGNTTVTCGTATAKGMLSIALKPPAAPQPPVANFTGTPTSGPAPLTVAFTDTSTGSPTSWSWTFGDSSTSTVQNPSHTYNSTGSFTVALTATNAQGSNTNTKTNYITVTVAPPVANFAGTPTSGAAPLTVAFTDTSTGSPTSWSWTFGDASTSTAQNPSHTYAAGTYTVALTATNAGGSNTNTKTNYITATGGSQVYVYPTSWETMSNALVTLISGTVADLQSDNGVYLVGRTNTSNYDSGFQFNFDTTYTPSQVNKIKVEVQFKDSRADTPEYWSNMHTVGGGNTNMLAFTLWPTTDQTFTWETTAVSTYLSGAGDMSFNVCGCSVNSNVYDTSFDLVRITLTLN